MTQRRWDMRGQPQIVQGNGTSRQCALCGDPTCVLFSFDPGPFNLMGRICLCEVCLVEATVWIRECVEEED